MGPRQWMANVRCFLDTLFLVQQSLVPIVMATGLPSHIRYLSVKSQVCGGSTCRFSHMLHPETKNILSETTNLCCLVYQYPFPAIIPQPCSIPRSFQFGETSVLSIPYDVTCMSLLCSVQCLSSPFVLFPSTEF